MGFIVDVNRMVEAQEVCKGWAVKKNEGFRAVKKTPEGYLRFFLVVDGFLKRLNSRRVEKPHEVFYAFARSSVVF